MFVANHVLYQLYYVHEHNDDYVSDICANTWGVFHLFLLLGVGSERKN